MYLFSVTFKETISLPILMNQVFRVSSMVRLSYFQDQFIMFMSFMNCSFTYHVFSNRTFSLCLKNVPFFKATWFISKVNYAKNRQIVPLTAKLFYISLVCLYGMFYVSIIFYFSFVCFQIYISIRDIFVNQEPLIILCLLLIWHMFFFS